MPSWCIWSMASIISIHAPARGATFCHLLALLNTRNFNPRSREGSDGFFGLFQILSSYFNPRSREGSDCRSLFRFSRSCDFNPRSREGSDSFAAPTLNLLSNFNPRSREGSDAILSRDPRNAEISIHAPARGATMQAQKRAILQRISIHAPARGATRSLFRIAKAGSYFNPRSREGSDVNPLPRRGASIRFQSTLPRGERRSHRKSFTHYSAYFNPRSREGSDGISYESQFQKHTISIHAPARGATFR